MGRRPDWTGEALKQFTARNSPNFEWLEKPGRHQFRWRTIKGKWITAKRRIKDHDSFTKSLKRDAALDVYVSTSQWLDPINLPRLSDNDKPAPILLDHLVVFDIDIEPFSRHNLEKARKAAIRLIDWIEKNEPHLDYSHATFSGSKGFHIFYRDEDRVKFSIANPRERENKVRIERKALLERVIMAEHPVDPLVTADTRRIIRLPGTIHGGTGWICTIIERKELEKPLKEWIHLIPKHQLSIRMPRWKFRFPQFDLRQKKKVTKKKQNDQLSIFLQVSSQVPGTPDRNVILKQMRGTPYQITKRIEKFISMLESEEIGPCAIWTNPEGALIMVPRAIPNQNIMKIASKIGMKGFSYEIKKKGHSWVKMTPNSLDLLEGALEPRGVYALDSGKICSHPWSNAHLRLAEQLGVTFSIENGQKAGNPQVSSRIVKIR